MMWWGKYLAVRRWRTEWKMRMLYRAEQVLSERYYTGWSKHWVKDEDIIQSGASIVWNMRILYRVKQVFSERWGYYTGWSKYWVKDEDIIQSGAKVAWLDFFFKYRTSNDFCAELCDSYRWPGVMSRDDPGSNLESHTKCSQWHLSQLFWLYRQLGCDLSHPSQLTVTLCSIS
jgi:hypothetical protein